jgi:hypothetical protein
MLSQVVVHIRNSPNFCLENLIRVENFLISCVDSKIADFDGHDYGSNDSNIFVYTTEPKLLAGHLSDLILEKFPDINFAIGARIENSDLDYEIIVSEGVREILIT